MDLDSDGREENKINPNLTPNNLSFGKLFKLKLINVRCPLPWFQFRVATTISYLIIPMQNV